MSKAAGDLTCGELQEVQIKMDRIWADASVNVDYIAEVTSISAIRENQTAQLTVLEDREKDKQLKITWVEICGTTIKDDCNTTCTPGGTELSINCKDYSLNLCNSAGFTIPEYAFRTSNYSREEVVARAFLRADQELCEWYNEQAILAADSYTGINQYDTGLGKVCGHDTYLEAAMWTPEIMGYFMQTAVINRQRNSYMLSGTNLSGANWQAMMNAQNLDGKGAQAMMGSMRKYFDLFKIDSTIGKKTLLISPYAMAVWTKNYYSEAPINYIGAGLTNFSIQSKNLPWVRFDVTYTTRCAVVGGVKEMYHDYTLQLHAGVYQNPLPCNTEQTGILSFVCGTAPC